MRIKNMIDTHTHILSGLDDGARSIDESMEMAKTASKHGVKKIVATPHKMVGSNEINKELVDSLVNELNDALTIEKIDVEIVSGAENYAEFEIDENLTINGTRYFLIELPMYEYPAFFNKLVDGLLEKGKIPIIAHPEVNYAIRRKPQLLLDLVNKGCICQLNAKSILGFNGLSIKKAAEWFLYNNVYKLIGSNMHTYKSKFRLIKAVKAASEIIGRENAIAMVSSNAEKVLNNEVIQNRPIERLKTSILDRILVR